MAMNYHPHFTRKHLKSIFLKRSLNFSCYFLLVQRIELQEQNKRINYCSLFMAMNYYPHFTRKPLKSIFLKRSLNFSCYFLLVQRIELQEQSKEMEGLCFSYLFDSKIITKDLHEWPKCLMPEVTVSGFHDLSPESLFLVVTFSTALEVFTTGARGKHGLWRVQCQACVRQSHGL